ncbi:MAG TPA: YihY/virulence factor BrkB family protein [Oceanobacillus sp.]|nr:YihY/virulence factor BrkB family protein [Oceanobacillus sp.]
MLRTRFQHAAQRFDQWWTRQSSSTRALPSYLARALANYWRYGSRQAAALSYYAIFSVFPLSLLATILVSRLVGPVVAQQQLTLALQTFLPPSSTATLELFQTNVQKAIDQGSSFTLIAILFLMWSGLGLFSNITSALDFIFHVPSSRSLWSQRLIALVMALVLIALLVTSFVTSAVLGFISTVLLNPPSVWISIGAFFLPLGLDMMIFALLFRYVPARKVYWDAVWPAAIFGAIGWEIAKTGFGWFLSYVDYQFVYGAIAAGIVLLFWAYIIASIFLLSAEICAQLNEWLLDQHWQDEAQRFLEGKAVARLPSQQTDEKQLSSVDASKTSIS